MGGINGAYGNTAENNKVNINGGNVNLTGTGIIRGGYGTTSASGNAVNITGGNVNAYGLIGGGYGTVKDNTINISGGTVNIEDEIRGGEGDTVNNNTVNISGGTVNAKSISGGFGNSVANNLVNITGGTIIGNIFAGKSYSSVNDNTINISGSPDLSATSLFGYTGDASTHSGNTLNIYSKDLTAKNIHNFDNINFYIQKSVSNGDTLLTLTDSGGTDLSGVSIKAGVVSGNSNLKVGDTINLLTNSNGLTTSNGTTYAKLTSGVSETFDLSITRSGNSVVGNITRIPGTLNPETQILPVSTGGTSIGTITTSLDTPTIETPTVTFETSTVDNKSGDTVTTDNQNIDNSSTESDSDNSGGNSSENANATIVEARGWEIFANMGGGSLRTKAGDGSHVDMTTQSINLGFARSLAASAGRFTIAPVIDYAHGNYDSYLENGTHGNGSTRYIAGGLIARRMLQNGFYYETSVRVGKVKTDFSSDNIDKTGAFGRVTYSASSTTVSGHLKIGKAFRLNRNNMLDVYATYYHAHQGGMNADLSSGEHYRFSSADSGRLRLGYRLTTRNSKISQIYTGLAYQYENASGITATFEVLAA